MRPVKYAKNGKVNIAYRVFGSGPLDIVFVPGHISHLEFGWDLAWAPITERLASFARVICFDKRGTGLSERVSESELPTLEERMEDVRVVMDAAGSLRAAIVAVSEGCSMALLFAATHPERTTALVLYAGFARIAWAPDLPWGMRPAEQEVALDLIESTWGTGASMSFFCPSVAGNRGFREQYGRLENGGQPGRSTRSVAHDLEIDVRPVLPSVSVPT
jgi:pimeloyl-ACP methyl ester carboxylesterase